MQNPSDHIERDRRWELTGAAILIPVGLVLCGLLALGWRIAPDGMVLTIFPMMGTPYIIAVGALVKGVTLLVVGEA